MIEENRNYGVIRKPCKIRHYIEGDFDFDTWFYTSPTPVVDKNDEIIYFDTRESAEKYIEENRKRFFCELEIKEEIIPIE